MPPLSDRVAIPEYAVKLLKQGVIFVLLDERLQECGMIAFYSNDQVHHTGFITFLAVTPGCRGRGLGRKLVEHSLAEMSMHGMTHARLEVHVGNAAARELYASCGFKELNGNSEGQRRGQSIIMTRVLDQQS